MSKIQEAIELLNKEFEVWIMQHPAFGKAVLLLEEVEQEQACPACKGTRYIPVHPVGEKIQENIPIPKLCPDCKGTGTYKAWAEKRIADLEAKNEQKKKHLMDILDLVLDAIESPPFPQEKIDRMLRKITGKEPFGFESKIIDEQQKLFGQLEAVFREIRNLAGVDGAIEKLCDAGLVAIEEARRK